MDCHLHTVVSGVLSADPGAQLAERAQQTALDVVYITDHNVTSAAVMAAERDLGVRIIVGEEIRTPVGDVIGLFLTERIPYVLPLHDVVTRIRAQGGLVYAPHPFDQVRSSLAEALPALCAEGVIDVIEVFNAKIPLDQALPRPAAEGARGSSVCRVARAPTRTTPPALERPTWRCRTSTARPALPPRWLRGASSASSATTRAVTRRRPAVGTTPRKSWKSGQTAPRLHWLRESADIAGGAGDACPAGAVRPGDRRRDRDPVRVGQEAVQMKDLAQRAGVSLATLYRYFPSKEYLLLAVALARYQARLAHGVRGGAAGDTVRERVAAHLRREFRAQQRNQRLTAALAAAMTGGGRSYSSIIEAVEHTHWQVIGTSRRAAARSASSRRSCCSWCATSPARRRGAGWPGPTPSPTPRRSDRDRLPAARAPRRGDRRAERVAPVAPDVTCHAGRLGLSRGGEQRGQPVELLVRARRTAHAATWRSSGTGARRAPR